MISLKSFTAHFSHVFMFLKALTCSSIFFGVAVYLQFSFYVALAILTISMIASLTVLNENKRVKKLHEKMMAGSAGAADVESKGIVDDLIKSHIGERLVYNISWEDPRIDVEVIQFRKDTDNVIMLTSAGDNVIDYLIERPRQIVTTDINTCQSYFLDLKLASIESLEFEEFFAIFALSDFAVFQKVYQSKIRPRLRTDASRAYWDMPKTQEMAKNWARAGTSGHFSEIAIKILRLFGGGKFLDMVVDPNTKVDALRDYYQKSFKKVMDNCATYASWFINPVYQVLAAVPHNQSDGKGILRKSCDFVESVVMKSDMVNDNYFYYFYIAGKYTEKNCPRYLQKQHFESIKGITNRVVIEHGFLCEVLAKYPDNYFHVASLLDHMDWLNEVDTITTFDTLRKKMEVKTRAKLFWRSFHSSFDHPYVTSHLNVKRILPDVDRVCTYDGTFIADFRQDILTDKRTPYITQSSNIEDLVVFGRMMTFPIMEALTLGGNADHKKRLDEFYLQQAIHYDQYRNRMLHGRQYCIDSIPFKAGDVWVDIGGGTASNIEYVLNLLPKLKKVIIIDICKPLLDIARLRVAKLGLQDKVELIEADATTFDVTSLGPIDVVTFSYSLTMIPAWEKMLDVAKKMLSKTNGIIAVTDFTVLDDDSVSSLFWRNIFKRDHVNLSTAHIAKLKSTFNTKAITYGSGSFPYVPFLRCPYYIYVGTAKSQ